ncbi:MAG: hypothetical protein K1W10_01355 [Lachnospiraceae bacterium]
MEKKMWLVGAIIVIAFIAVFGGWYVAFCEFGIGPAFPFLPSGELGEADMISAELAEHPLMALTETQEQAQKIAELYGIKMVSFEDGIAVYDTDQDPYDVIAEGEKKGYPILSINYVRTSEELDRIPKLE